MEQTHRDNRVEQMYRDLYVGNGRKSITTRLNSVEENLERLSKNSGKLVWMIIGLIIMAAGNIVINMLEKGILGK